MDAAEFARRLDEELGNPLLGGLEIARLTMEPKGALWWSPHAHRVLVVHVLPGSFGADRLACMTPRRRRIVEEAAARVMGADEARLVPSLAIRLRLADALVLLGDLILSVGGVLTAPVSFAAWALIVGAGAMLNWVGEATYERLHPASSGPYRRGPRPRRGSGPGGRVPRGPVAPSAHPRELFP